MSGVDCGLQRHNELRRGHEGTNDMILDNKLNNDAQNWADNIARMGEMQHDNNSLSGENIAKFVGHSGNDCEVVKEAVDNWYDEKKDYNFSNGRSNGGETRHFTQVVWKKSVKLGIGIARNGSNTYVVGRYSPRGNYTGQNLANVGSEQASTSQPTSPPTTAPTKSPTTAPIAAPTTTPTDATKDCNNCNDTSCQELNMHRYRSKLEVNNSETIRVCAGGIVDSIQVGDDDRGGGSGGPKKNEFTLEAGETIIRVTGTRVRYPNEDSDLCIGEIKFETNKGHVHGPFGDSAKNKNAKIEETFDFHSGLREISGKGSDYLNSINCTFQM